MISIADRANSELAAQPLEYQETVRARLRSRFSDLTAVLIVRRGRDAEFHAQQFVSAVNAIRLQHGDSVDQASQCLDRFIVSARSAVGCADLSGPVSDAGLSEAAVAEVTVGDSPTSSAVPAEAAEPWYESAQSLVQTFQLNQRAFESGRLAREDFMRGNEVLVAKLLLQVRSRVGASEGMDFWRPGERIPAPREGVTTSARGQEVQ